MPCIANTPWQRSNDEIVASLLQAVLRYNNRRCLDTVPNDTEAVWPRNLSSDNLLATADAARSDLPRAQRAGEAQTSQACGNVAGPTGAPGRENEKLNRDGAEVALLQMS